MTEVTEPWEQWMMWPNNIADEFTGQWQSNLK
jgi:hypothetical protein